VITSRLGYLLGVGSNIKPEEKIPQIIGLLLQHFSQLTLSRVVWTPPIGMNSQYDFLNVVIFIETTMTISALKIICNDIEVRLGRDRTDPERKTKDREADLDILCETRIPEDIQRTPASITNEYFLYPMITEIIHFLAGLPVEPNSSGVALETKGLAFGKTPATIYRNADSSNKSII